MLQYVLSFFSAGVILFHLMCPHKSSTSGVYCSECYPSCQLPTTRLCGVPLEVGVCSSIRGPY